MWQPIETAPRNQTFLAVLNCAGEQTICTMRWPVAEAKNSRPDNKTFHVERVTHWMPLPELPAAQPTQNVKDAIIDDLQSQFDSEGITEHNSGDALIRLSDAIAAVEDNFAQPTQNVADGWLRAIDEALVTAHIGGADENDTYEQAKAKLDNLIGFHTDVATDPAVNGGWKLMPAVSTCEMDIAGASHCDGYLSVAAAVWDAMFAAAPEVKE